MSTRLVPLALLVALVGAGCVAPNAAELDSAVAIELPTLDPSTYLFFDPENAPHPAYGWPTLNAPAGGNVPAWWNPIPAMELPATIAGIEHLVQAEDVPAGGGIAIFGSLVVVPGLGQASTIVDISDPAAPVALSHFEGEQGGHRGAAIIAYPDGKLAATMATGKGFEVWDITDPKLPVLAAAVEPTKGGHKVGVVPGTPILYNANSWGGGDLAETARLTGNGNGITEIYDLTDPYAPVLVQDFANGYGCHHIYFWNSAEKQRAICAGIEYAQIWDVADPKAPTIIVSIPIPHGNTALPSPSLFPVATPFAHFSILNDDGTILIVGDEFGGGSLPPGCTAAVNNPVRDTGAPTGALWFYDVSDETNPRMLGWFSPGQALAENMQPLRSCTAHHGRLVPQADGRDLLAMSFYAAGVVLVDFTDPANPDLVDQFVTQGQDVWETWYYNGYLFTGDIQRGLDVLTFT